MKRIWAVLVAMVFVAGALVAAPGVALAADSGFSMKDRFARETTRLGDRDKSTYSIDHVTELQHRLKREGVFSRPVTGHYSKGLRNAVRRFQRSVDLRASGVATHQTWARLIPRSNIRLARASKRCDGKGWHVCYDRTHHQLTLWRGGKLWNSWLVRGGRRTMKTRTGNTTVYWRDKDHVSGLYDAPMPYSQFFDGGQALHGSRVMIDPYAGHSHGCINMYVEDARQLWRLTHDRRLRVHVYGAWD